MDEWAQHQQGHQGQPAQPSTPWLGLPQAGQREPEHQVPPGFVMPGTAAGQPPLGFQGGLIGVPQQQPQQYAQPQHVWAYPTPHGMQLVQAGPAAYAAAPAFQPQYAPQPYPQPQLHAHPELVAEATPRAKSRLRWETIVPIVAVVCFLAAVALLVSDFDRITGRDSADAPRTTAATASAQESGVNAAPIGDVDSALTEATTLLVQGRFDAATTRLQPFLALDAPDGRVTKLAQDIDAASTRNDALLAQLGRQRQAKQWPKVITTLKQLQALRPLSADLVAIRAQALKQIKANAAAAKAKAARAAAAKQTATGGGGAPSAGGQSNTSTSAKPPTSSPPASAPKAPNVPNTTVPSASGGGGSGVSGGQPTVTAPAVAPVGEHVCAVRDARHDGSHAC